MACIENNFCINSGGNLFDGQYTTDSNTYNGFTSYTGDSVPFFIYYSLTEDRWCLSTSFGGSCLQFGPVGVGSDCPDFDESFFITGVCITTTTTTSPCDVFNFEAIFDCLVPTTTTTTKLPPTTTTTTTIPFDPCTGVSVSASITAYTTTTTTIPVTTTTTTGVIRPCNFDGIVTFNTFDEYMRCGNSKKFKDCLTGFEYFSNGLIFNESGDTLIQNWVYKSTINGISTCVSFLGLVDNISGSDLVVINETLGSEFQGACLECVPDSTTTTTTKGPADYFVECGDGFCPFGNVNFGPRDNLSTLFNSWNRFALFAPNKYPGLSTLTGLQSNGILITNDPSYYFWTGSTNYLGAFNLVMTEGENVGPVASDFSNVDKFYYNTYINKMIFSYDVGGSSTYRWSTFDPTANVSTALGNPTTTQYLTTSSNWKISGLTSVQYTVSGTSNTVVLAQQKILDAGGTPEMIQCVQNSAFGNGFYSNCEYTNYVHEVTLGSTDNDNDKIGIVLAAKKGLGNNPKVTDMLSLIFNGTNNRVNVDYNPYQDVYAFNNNMGLTSVTIMTGATNPFGAGNYNVKGQVRIKIIKTNTTISIYTTQRMGPLGIVQSGNPNPYTLLYQFDLTDKTTWNAAPNYALGNELLKFTGGTSFGYLTTSQRKSQFYDILFSSTQQPSGILYSKTVSNPILGKVYSFIDVDGCFIYSGSTFNFSNSDLVDLTIETVNNSCQDC